MILTDFLKNPKCKTLWVFLLFFTGHAQCLEYTSIVKAKKTKAIVTHRFTREEISGKSTLAEVLNAQAGVWISQNPFTPQQASLRGGLSQDVLILIDDVIVNDPTTPSGQFNFLQIPTHQVSRIEIQKGLQAIRYGGRAAAGLIKIYTHAFDNNSNLSLFGTSPQSLAAGISKANTGLNTSLSRDRSPVKGSTKGYQRSQSFLNYSNSGLNLLHSDQIQFLSGSGVDQVGFKTRSQLSFISLNEQLITSALPMSILMSHSLGHRNYMQDTQPTLSGYIQNYSGKRTSLELTNKKPWTLLNTSLSSGVCFESESYEYLVEKSRTFSALHLQTETPLGGDFILGAGLRAEQIPQAKTLFNPGLTLEAENWSFLLEASQQAPSVYQSLDPVYGNSDLLNEYKQNTSINLLLLEDESAFATLVLFSSTYQNRIAYDSSLSRYRNMNHETVDGLELDLSQITSHYKIQVSLLGMSDLELRPRSLVYFKIGNLAPNHWELGFSYQGPRSNGDTDLPELQWWDFSYVHTFINSNTLKLGLNKLSPIPLEDQPGYFIYPSFHASLEIPVF